METRQAAPALPVVAIAEVVTDELRRLLERFCVAAVLPARAPWHEVLRTIQETLAADEAGSTKSNQRRRKHMVRSAKTALLTLVLSGLLTGCEDKQCKAELQSCRSTSESQTKSMDSLRAENEGLKAKAAQVDQLMARVQELTKENEALKAAPPNVATKHK